MMDVENQTALGDPATEAGSEKPSKSGRKPPNADVTGDIAAKKLRSFVEKIERLEGEKADLSADIREVYAEAKGNGFDTKIMRQVLKLKKMEEPDRKELDEVLDLYRAALDI